MKERGASVAQVGNEVISNAIFEPSGRSLASDLVGLVQVLRPISCDTITSVSVGN